MRMRSTVMIMMLNLKKRAKVTKRQTEPKCHNPNHNINNHNYLKWRVFFFDPNAI